MTARILTLANARGMDLKHPRAEDYAGFAWVAEHLAKEKRFNGATPGVEYSVAEHMARGMRAILDATGDRLLAACFGLHDVPEAVLKDLTTPLKRTLADIAHEEFGTLAEAILGAFDSLEYRHDAACHAAAGVPFPLPAAVKRAVKLWDLTMFVTEWRDLMGALPFPDPTPYAGIDPLVDVIVPMTWQDARDVYLELCRATFPALSGRSA